MSPGKQTSSSADLPRLPPRAADCHKGDFGRVLVVGGSRGMSGAAALAGLAALRCGAGLVTIAVPASCLTTVAGIEPSYMTVPLAEDADGRIAPAAGVEIAARAAKASVVAIGPGLGQSAELVELVGWLYETLAAPLVVDADGLNALARRRERLDQHAGPRILTPHPGELARLTGSTAADRPRMEQQAQQLAADAQVVVILKGHRSLVTDGTCSSHNATGNPGMATGGTGDVLTGVVAALVAQGLSPYDAARLAAYVHGLAGDLAAAELGQMSLIASDLIRFLPAAFRTL